MNQFYRAMYLALFCCLSWAATAENPPIETDFIEARTSEIREQLRLHEFSAEIGNETVDRITSQPFLENSCGSDRSIDAYAFGVKGQNRPCFDLPNPENITKVTVELWVAGNRPPATIEFTAGGGTTGARTANASRIDVMQAAGSRENEYIFRTTFDGNFSEICSRNSDGRSMAIYVERAIEGAGSSLYLVDRELHSTNDNLDCVTIDAELLQSDGMSEIRFDIPIHEKGDTGRPLTIEIDIKDNNNNVLATKSEVFTEQNAGSEASLFSMAFQDMTEQAVAATITICSPVDDGESFGVGLVSYSADCLPEIPCSGTGFPIVTVEQTNPECGLTNGEIKFSYPNNPGRTHIEFSLDGGNSYPLDVEDNTGMASFRNLAVGDYDIYVRWGNTECPLDLGIINLTDGSVAPGTSCNDGNADTGNDVIQADGCTCEGTIIDPCAAKGGDNDNDGICFDDDCNDFNASIGAKQPVGSSCDDGNPNTVNDEIQADGCGCFGLPRGDISIFCPADIDATAAQGATGTVVFFGQPNGNSSCALGGLSINQTAGPVSGSNFPVGTTTITYTATDACGNSETCSFEVTVTVMVDPCAAKGGDADGDGVCADDDCDDNNPGVGAKQPQGTSCNDGNSNTINDVIQADGCTCIGVMPDPCTDKGGDSDGDGVCADDDCDDNDASVGAKQAPGTSCNDGNSSTNNDMIQQDGCTCAGTAPAKAAVGDFVFRDNNGNGIQDDGEPGIRGVFVLLTNVNTGVAKFAVTGADGMYLFSDVDPGDYTIKFAGQSNDLTTVAPGQGNDPTKDSDYDPLTGITPVFTLAAGEVNMDIDGGFKPRNITPVCTADAGTLSGGGSVTIVAGTAPVSATPNGDEVIPAGYSKIYVLTLGTELVIQQTNSTPSFTVDAAGKYTVHTLVYDPSTLDLSIVVPGLTTGFDVNSILIQGGGTICAALDVQGAMTMVMDPMTGCPGNVTNGGSIGNNEDPAACGPFDPAAMFSLVDPSGGNGAIEYIWLASTTGCPTELIDQIAGATGSSYDPGPISQTTYYVRCSRTVGCTVWIESDCVIKTVDDCGTGGGLTCDDAVIAGGEGKINITNIAANAKIEYNGPSTSWAVVELCNGNCGSSEMITDLPAGEYNVKIQSFDPYCYRSVTVSVTDGGGNDPCENAGGDSDGDGVCDNDDNCRNTPNADQADNDGDGIGNVCDDTPNGGGNDPCENAGGDSDGDGVCDNLDNCRNTPNADQADNDGDGIGNVCDDTPNGGGNTSTCEDVVVTGGEGKITISNIPTNAKLEYNGPSTSWGLVEICNGDCGSMEMISNLDAGEYTIKAQSFDPYCYAEYRVTVTDGGNNDPCANAGGDSDGDGICDNLDNCRNTANADQADNDGDGIGNVCDDTPNGGGNTGTCDDAVIAGGEGKINITNIPSNAKIEYNGPSTSWAVVELCNGNCGSSEMITGLPAGEYNVKIQSFDPYCYRSVPVVVTDGGNNDPCANAGGDSDGDGICDNLDNCRNTPNADQADNDGDGIGNVCDDTPNGGGNDPCVNAGGDSDGDGICDNDDNCRNTPNADQADNDGDGIGNVCDDTPNGNSGPDCSEVVVSAEPGKLIISNLTAPIVALNILDKNAGYASIYECFNDCDLPMTMLTLPASDYLVKVQYYTASWGFNCEKEFDITVPGGVDPCANAGGDADGDGICAADDCDDNNANIGSKQAQGTACNDGNADTENDVIQADGCSCAGTPVGPSKCANRTVINTENCRTGVTYGFYIVTDGFDRYFTFQDGLFMEFDDGTAMLTGRITNRIDNQISFDVNINFTGRTQNSPTGAAKEHNCLHPDESTYYYYTDLSGTLMGIDKAAGAVLTVRNHAQAFQLGEGANVTNHQLTFGASGWLAITVQSQPTGSLNIDILAGANNGQNGDININLSGNGTECPNGASSRNGNIEDQLRINANTISVYPNPAQEALFINLKQFAGKAGNIKIMNLYGQLVQEVAIDKIADDLTRLDVSAFQNGLYHLTIKVENTQPVTKKVLVSRMY